MSFDQNDVAQQIQHMIEFIQQEAAEKIEEIEIKGEEEFNIEKSRLISQQCAKIIEYYDRKENQIELQRKIQHSTLANANHLFILKVQHDYVQALKEEARKQLIILTKDRAKYITILANLIIQGLVVLMEPIVTIRCRHDDYGLVQRLIPDAIQRYKRELKQKDIIVIVDDENFLSDDIAGGVELYAMEGRIKLINTVEARLKLIFDQMLPEIRQKLLGINQNRKHYD